MMGLGPALREFAHDPLVAGVIALIFADFVLGVMAAFKPPNTFTLSYVSDFLRNDVMLKVFPWFFLYALDFFTHGADLISVGGVGVGWGVVAGSAYVAMLAALTGSLLRSLKTLGISTPAPLSRPENAAPPKD
jgi:hypothetical protein